MTRLSEYREKIKVLFVFIGLLSLLVGIYQCFFAENFSSDELILEEEKYQELDNNEIIRFHVLAHSNTKKDQRIKYKVKNEVLNELDEVLKDTKEIESALKELNNSKEQITSEVEGLLSELDYEYEAKIKLIKKSFPPRWYREGALRGGEYYAFQVEIGKGKGDNYWCVLFPPLCYVDAVVEKDEESDENKIKEEEEKIDKEVRFFLIEWIEEFFK